MAISKRRLGLAALLGLAVQASLTGFVYGVENIRNESWSLSPPIRWEPGETAGSVTFDAQLTPLDLLYGVRFAILLQPEGGSPQNFIAYSFDRLECLPPAGTNVQVEANFALSCFGRTSRLYGRSGTCRLSYGAGTVEMALPAFWPGLGTATLSGGFQLLLRDEYTGMGSTPLAVHGPICAVQDPNRPPIGPSPTPADGTIGIYFDAAGSQCQGTIQPGVPGTVYVLARPNGATAAGIAGAEFRFAGVPESWQTYPVPNAEVLAIGDPFDFGVVVASTCLSAPDGIVPLYSVAVLATAAEPDVEFRIEMRNPPTNLGFQCPLLLACDGPAFTKYCVFGQPCFVNPSAPRICGYAVSVEQRSWTAVKQLFR